MKKLMIYGATGYTGNMIVQHALDAGLRINIAGRNRKNWQKWHQRKISPFAYSGWTILTSLIRRWSTFTLSLTAPVRICIHGR